MCNPWSLVKFFFANYIHLVLKGEFAISDNTETFILMKYMPSGWFSTEERKRWPKEVSQNRWPSLLSCRHLFPRRMPHTGWWIQRLLHYCLCLCLTQWPYHRQTLKHGFPYAGLCTCLCIKYIIIRTQPWGELVQEVRVSERTPFTFTHCHQLPHETDANVNTL